MTLDEQIEATTKLIAENNKNPAGKSVVEILQPYEHLQNLIHLKMNILFLKQKP